MYLINILVVAASLFSIYIYGWLTIFGLDTIDSQQGDRSEDYKFYVITSIFETIFAINIAKNFVTEYIPEDESIPVRDF